MNAKFEWFGFSVARKHVYFYSLLIVASLLANTIKDQFNGPSEGEKAVAQFNRLTEELAAFESSIKP